MAIDILYPETHGLAHADMGFYPVRITVSHWQLRHYISSPEQDHLYYASGQDVFCLNTATKKRKLITTLPFESRCTASGYGWVCVGGEHDGHFAAIKLDGSGQHTLDVDAALPVEDAWRQNVTQRPATVKVERIGEEIVNSISIHRIQDEEAHLDDIVAVLTNNDKTVRVYSLPSGQETTVKDLHFPINHATISPDGLMLIAVGDYNQAYFFTRDIVDTPPQIPKPHNRLTSASVEWRLMHVVTLHCIDSTLGYFTTAWSPNGRLVAAGSEGGYITIIDRDMLVNPELDDDEAIVAVMPGSRPDGASPYPGAIRSMMFSPDPWDLLIWAEDQGHICVGDLRTGLKSRQVINLEPEDERLNRVAFEDVDSDEHPSVPHLDDLEADLLRRYRDGNGSDGATAVNFATEYIEARRRQRQQRQELVNNMARLQTSSRQTSDGDDPQGLTAREQQILESLRMSRQREEARTHGAAPRSVNYTTADLFSSSSGRSHSSAEHGARSSRRISETLNIVQDVFPELSRVHATSAQPSSSHRTEQPPALPPIGLSRDSSIAWASSSRSTIPRGTDNSRLPRRRQSIVLDAGAASGELPGNDGATQRAGSAAPGAGDSEHDNPWRTIEEQMAAARGPLFEGAGRVDGSSPLPATDRLTPEMLQQELAAQRRLTQAQARPREQRERLRTSRAIAGGERAITMAEERRLAAFPDGYETLLRRTQMRGFPARDIGARTAGLAMSPDGRRLWAACEEGIFEMQIKVQARMFSPALEPR